MKIVKEKSDTISIQLVNPLNHIVAAINPDGRVIVAMRNGTFESPGDWRDQIFTPHSIDILNNYTGHSATLEKLISETEFEWHAFETAHEFFTWAAGVTGA